MSSASFALNARSRQIACIVGMAMVWPSIHNQLFYPITFSFHKAETTVSPYPFYLVYSLVILAMTLLLAFVNKERLTTGLFTSKLALGVFAAMGTVGIFLLVICDPATTTSTPLMGIGMAFAAVFVPFYFIFWCTQIIQASKKRAAFDAIMSYVAFCLVSLLRLAFNIHAWVFSIWYPLISGALAIFVLSGKSPVAKATNLYAYKRISRKNIPFNLVVPNVLLVYAATASRCLMAPLSATYDYPPRIRILMYVCIVAALSVLAILYRPKGKTRNKANYLSFALVAIFLVGSVLLTGVGNTLNLDLSNFPTIAGINVTEVFVLLLLLSNSQTKHVGIIQPVGAYLIAVIGVSHLSTVLFVGWQEIVHLDASQMPILVITVILAFLVVVIIIASMSATLYSQQRKLTKDQFEYRSRQSNREETTQKKPLDEVKSADIMPSGVARSTPPCMTIASDEKAYLQVQETFKLSKREADVLRLVAQNMSAKEIAEALYVAESTVNSHTKAVYRKCDVHSRKELKDLVNRFKRDLI